MTVVERAEKAIEQLRLNGNKPIRIELNKADYAAIQAEMQEPEGWPVTLCGLEIIQVETINSAAVGQGSGPIPGRVSHAF